MGKKFFLVAVLALAISGCTALTSAPVGQAKTVAEAIQSTALAEKALDVYITSTAANPAVLAQLKILVPAVHNALKQVEAAQANGNSALAAGALASFNESLAALNSYEQLRGVGQ